MPRLLNLLVAPLVVTLVAAAMPPSCEKKVFCDSALLHHVQLARLFPDSKTFVDLHLINDPDTTLADFDALLQRTNNAPSRDQLKQFVEDYFDDVEELNYWTPTDLQSDPKFLQGIRDETLRQFGRDVNAIWPILGRKVRSEVFADPNRFSLIPVTHGFIIPGGRFKELYYWDTYWIVEGLLISDMYETAKGVISNLIELLNTVGLVPNGGRWYYQERSQPPLLTAMVSLYYRYTHDIDFLRDNIQYLEKEVNRWLDTQLATVEKNGRTHHLLRYFTISSGPRPESYYEDYTDAQIFPNEERRTEFYIDLKSAAESGWDFSSRWFISEAGDNNGNLTDIHTKFIIPVDLNAIYTNSLQNIAYFQALLGNPDKAAHWGTLARQFRNSIEAVLWDETDGVWYDYDIANQIHRKYFFPTNVSPLWMGAVEKGLVRARAPRILQYLRNSRGLDFPGGIPASLSNSGEQWDFPNAWPPLVSIVVNALEALGTAEARYMAFDVAQTWVRANHKGFTEHKQMFEKYDVETPGLYGGGGEYAVQEGFGWSNGVVLEFLSKYGRTMTVADTPPEEKKSDKPAVPAAKAA